MSRRRTQRSASRAISPAVDGGETVEQANKRQARARLRRRRSASRCTRAGCGLSARTLQRVLEVCKQSSNNPQLGNFGRPLTPTIERGRDRLENWALWTRLAGADTGYPQKCSYWTPPRAGDTYEEEDGETLVVIGTVNPRGAS